MFRIRLAAAAALVVTLAALTASDSAAQFAGARGVGADADKWLVNNPEAVMWVNIKGLLQAESVKKNIPELKKQLAGNQDLKAALDATGIDLFNDIHSILASGSGGKGKDARVLVAIRGNFDSRKINAAAKKKADEVKIHTEGNIDVYEVKLQDQPGYFALVNANMAVMTHSKAATVDAVKNGGKRAATLSKQMKAALGKFTGKETMNFAMLINDELKEMIAKVPQLAANAKKMETLSGSITVTDSVAIHLAASTSDVQAAKQLFALIKVALTGLELAAQGMENLPPVATEILQAIKIAAEKQDVTVNLTVTREMVEKVQKAAGKQ